MLLVYTTIGVCGFGSHQLHEDNAKPLRLAEVLFVSPAHLSAEHGGELYGEFNTAVCEISAPCSLYFTGSVGFVRIFTSTTTDS